MHGTRSYSSGVTGKLVRHTLRRCLKIKKTPVKFVAFPHTRIIRLKFSWRAINRPDEYVLYGDGTNELRSADPIG